MQQCWTLWLMWRPSQTLHPDSSSELKQIHHTCWERRLKSELVEHLCSWNTGTMKRVCLSLHSAHRLHSTQKKTADESQTPTTWMTDPASTGTDLALGKPLLSPVKLQNNQCIFFSPMHFYKPLQSKNRTQNSWKKQDKASKLVFYLKTTRDFLEHHLPKLLFMGIQGEQKSNGLPTGEGGEWSALHVMGSRC